MARVARAMMTAMRVAGNKESNGKGDKGNGNSNKGVRGGTAMATKRVHNPHWRARGNCLLRR
jgi:hypothetical protein